MVALLAGKTHYDRARTLSAAGRARSKGRRRKAISLYSKVLRFEPNNHILRKRVACLLAQVGRLSEAHEHYLLVTKGLSRRGFDVHAIGVYREALGFLPRERDLWSGLAELQAKQDHVRDAVETLRAGSRRFRSRRRRPDAIALLEQAHAIAPLDVDTAIDLSRLLEKSRDRPRAARVLWEALPGARGRALRRLRRRLFRLPRHPSRRGVGSGRGRPRRATDRDRTAPTPRSDAYLLLAVIRSYFPRFSDDGCTTSPDGLLGYDFSWACRIHDWRYCTRCHPPDSMSPLARRFADEELRMHMRASLPWYTRGWVPFVYRAVVRLFGSFGAWDSCGPERGELCRHDLAMPPWMQPRVRH